jgi:acyl-CoA dehydrogenase
VARLISSAGPVRDRLAENLYVPSDPDQALGRLVNAFRLVSEAAPVVEKIKEASRARRLAKGSPETLVTAALDAGVIAPAEAALVRAAAAAREDAIQVDSFTLAEYQRRNLLDAEAEAVTAR